MSARARTARSVRPNVERACSLGTHGKLMIHMSPLHPSAGIAATRPQVAFSPANGVVERGSSDPTSVALSSNTWRKERSTSVGFSPVFER